MLILHIVVSISLKNFQNIKISDPAQFQTDPSLAPLHVCTTPTSSLGTLASVLLFWGHCKDPSTIKMCLTQTKVLKNIFLYRDLLDKLGNQGRPLPVERASC